MPYGGEGTEEYQRAEHLARHACEEGQPMPLRDLPAVLVAEACERVAEEYAAARMWHACATARGMACWYYRTHVNE